MQLSSKASSDKPSPPSSMASLSSSFKEHLLGANGSKVFPDSLLNANAETTRTSKRLVLLVFSANDEKALQSSIRSFGSVAGNYEAAHLANTLATRRSRFSQRAFLVAPSDAIQESLNSMAVVSTKSQPELNSRIGFVFTGQGAQWPSMGRGLFNEYTTFQESIRYQDHILSRLSKRPPWRIEDILVNDDISHIIHDPMVSQTVCTALQIALVELLSSWGINPSATVGHSSGEIGAAYAAGRLTTSEAIVLAYLRGYTVNRNKRKGAMLAVGLSPAEVEPHLAGIETEIKIAAVNSPNSVTLSGETAVIEQVASQLQEKEVFNRILKTGGNAYHSHHMQALGSLYEHDAREGLDEIANLVKSETHRSPILWVSSVDPEKATKDIPVGPSYWRRNLESPVLFAPAVEQLMEQSTEDLDILLEIGPHPALAGPVKQIMQVARVRGSKIPAYFGSLKREKDDLESMLELGGNLFLQNASVNIDALNDSNDLLESQLPPLCLDLPNYKYNYGPILFHESRLNKEWRLRKHLRHDLLGARQLGSTSLCPSWRNMFRLKDVPWLGDHRLIPQAIFPAAGFIAMATEAVFQCHGEIADAPPIAGYTFRNVTVSSTLEVPDVEVGTDVVLNMQKMALNGNTTSTSWYEFKISSLNAETDSWIEHCTGLVKIESSENKSLRHFAEEETWHSVDVSKWYKRFAVLGLGYGPCFQGLSNLKFANGRAAADVELAPTKDVVNAESAYTLHPATLDNCLQLANIAAYSGNFDSAKQAYIPVMFDDLTIWNTKDREHSGPGYAVAEGKLRGSRGMYSRAQLFTSSGEVLMDMNYFKGISYDGIPFLSEDEEEKPQNPFSRLLWKPDITTLSNEKARELSPRNSSTDEERVLVEKLDKLSAYLFVAIFLQFQDTSFSSEQDHLKAFMEWICRCYARAAAGEIPFGLEAVAASSGARSDVINAIFENLGELVEIKLISRIFESMSAILSGQTTGLELALDDNILADLYSLGLGVSAAYPLMEELVDLLAHKFPRMKILEIGGGTAGATGRTLKTLEADSPFKRYQEYTFTDLTPSFLSAAQRDLAAYRGVKYSILNIELDPLEQGFAGEYDLVIASQVLHATSSLARTLQHVRKLLKPGGKFLLLEFTKSHPVSTIALGTFPYYWNGLTDGRAEGPLAGRDRWHNELLQNGFSGIDIVLGEQDSGLESASVIISTAIEQSDISPQNPLEPSIFIFTIGGPTAFAHCVAEQLRLAGLEHSFVTASNCTVSKGSRYISLIDLERVGAIFEDEVLFSNVKTVLLSASSILWVSSADIIQSPNPAAGLTVGLLRTIAREMPHLRLAQLSFDSNFDGSLEFARQVVVTENRHHTEKNLTQTDDLQIFQNGCLHISRLVPETGLNECYRIQEALDSEPRIQRIGSLGPIKVTTTRPGLLSSLQFEEDVDMLGTLPDDWVEIKSEAIDVNVKDIAVATGRFDLNTYSTACCGIVNKVGPLVQHLQIGDRVFGFAPGNFGNFVRVPAIYQQRMELTDSPTELASLPISYMTALYALSHLARIEKGESVLIQSAMGALGLATLRIARHLGAEIYATVGNSAKVELLEREFGINRDRIFSSREMETPKKIWESTGKKGIDVIISSTAGEQMQEFWRCIAPLGRFIEVGRLDVINHGKLPMEMFKRNATFSSFDIALLSRQKPQLGAA